MKPLALVIAIALFAAAVPGYAQADPQEQQIGDTVYGQLLKKGEIIARPNALYGVLDPIAARIARIANPQYDFPFTFILVHEKSPNAFAVPGGHVYVTDSLMSFVQNQEELAGVLCHETSHDIHHDVVNNNSKDQTIGAIIGILGSLTGLDKSGLGQIGENTAYTLQSNNFSRTVESNADHKGAQTCAQAGYNPWGMVWLFEHFQKSDTGGSMEALSDHPTNQHRVDDLKRYFANDRQLFGRFSPSIATATPMSLGPLTNAAVRTLPAPTAAAKPVDQSPAPYCCAPRT